MTAAQDTIVLTQGKKRKIKLSVKAEGGQLTYTSNTNKIKVDAGGTVIIPKDYTGKAVITVKASGEGYKDAAKDIVIKVKPKSMEVKKGKAGKTKISVKWKKGIGVSGYEVRCSAKKKFKKDVFKKSLKKNFVVIRRPEQGMKYYVKVRSYVTVRVNGKKEKLYSAWSKVIRV